MAELSIETQAIIDRLKAEGNLLRNSGANSIRSVKADLGKFEGLFDTIADNVIEQTDILRQSLLDSREQAQTNLERVRRESAEAELNRDNQDSSTSQETQTPIEQPTEKPERESKGLFGMIRGLINPKNLLIGGALLTALPVIYGFVDEMTDGKLTEIKDQLMDLDFSILTDNIGTIGVAVAGLAGLAAVMNTTMTTIAGLKLGTALTNFTTSLMGGGDGDGKDKKKGKKGKTPKTPKPKPGARVPGLGKALFAAAGIGILSNAQSISDYIQKEALGRTPGQVAGFDLADSAVDLGTYAAGGATLGAMFGPKGALIGAAAGAAFGLGKLAIDYIDDQVLDNGTLTNAMEDIVNERTEADSRLAELVQRRQKLLDNGLDTSRIEKEISDLETQIADGAKQAEQSYLEEKARLEEKLEKERIQAANRLRIAKHHYENLPSATNEKHLVEAVEKNKRKEQEILDQIKANEAAALKLGADYDVINPNSSLNGQGPLMDMGKTQEQINMEKAPTMSQFLDRMGGSTDQSVTIVKNSPVYNQVFNQGGSSSATNNSYVLAGSQGGGSDGLPI